MAVDGEAKGPQWAGVAYSLTVCVRRTSSQR